QALLTSKVTNVVNSCLAHLHKCTHFANKYSAKEVDRILILIAKLKKQTNLSKRIRYKNDLPEDDDNRLVRSLTTNSSSTTNLEPKVTSISNGWAFRWVENPETKALFSWLNLHLPNYQALSNRILKDSTKESIENISLSREQTEEAIAHYGKLLKKAKNQNIKIIAFVTDSA
ncbi:12734_t:CDS:2, partial [Dentiscutata heterogama]